MIFFSFIILGVFGGNFQTSNIEINEFENCFEYSENNEPTPIDCSEKLRNQSIFFGTIIILIIGGVVALLKGIKGDWDNRVKPEDMVGPSRGNQNDENNSENI